MESEDLYAALWGIGAESEGEPIRRDILDRLAQLKMIEIQPDGKPALTKFGELSYDLMEGGDGVPEFE